MAVVDGARDQNSLPRSSYAELTPRVLRVKRMERSCERPISVPPARGLSVEVVEEVEEEE